jgi:hypothetical protein
MRTRATIMTPTICGMLNPRMRRDAPPAQTLIHKLEYIVLVAATVWGRAVSEQLTSQWNRSRDMLDIPMFDGSVAMERYLG